MTQLDMTAALKARDEGIAQVSEHNQTFLESARGVARMLCREHGYTTPDRVRAECEKRGIKPDHHNAWGAVFGSREFEPGEYVRSAQVQGHGNRVRVWRLKGAAR